MTMPKLQFSTWTLLYATTAFCVVLAGQVAFKNSHHWGVGWTEAIILAVVLYWLVSKIAGLR